MEVRNCDCCLKEAIENMKAFMQGIYENKNQMDRYGIYKAQAAVVGQCIQIAQSCAKDCCMECGGKKDEA